MREDPLPGPDEIPDEAPSGPEDGSPEREDLPMGVQDDAETDPDEQPGIPDPRREPPGDA